MIKKKNKIIKKINSQFDEEYRLQTSEETLQYKIGICWDHVELERELFKGYDFKTYFISYNKDFWIKTHTFLVYRENNSYYWFENSWYYYQGVHKYNSLNELLVDISKKHLKYHKINGKTINDVKIYEYLKPPNKISADQFIKYCQKQRLIEIKEQENINEKV